VEYEYLSAAGRRLSCLVAALIALAWLVIPIPAYAGAWTQDAGHGQIILTTSFFQTAQNFDSDGTPRTFADRGRFRQFLVESYFEYGLTQRSTLVLHLPAPFLDYSNVYGAQHSAGPGDVEIALRRRLNSSESPWAASAQITVALPAYPADRNPAPGNHQQDVEARFLLGRGANWKQHHLYWDAEAAFRYRAGAPADQFRNDVSVGFDLTRRLGVIGQTFVINGLRNGDPLRANSNPNAQSDFDLYKAQVSLVLKLSHGTRLQAGWNNAFAGRNTGTGQAVVLAVWKSF
jgi:hypothetical protein